MSDGVTLNVTLATARRSPPCARRGPARRTPR